MVKRAEDVRGPVVITEFAPTEAGGAHRTKTGFLVATDRGITPFGSCGSLAVTEKDTVV
jgi:hypothetical protein